MRGSSAQESLLDLWAQQLRYPRQLALELGCGVLRFTRAKSLQTTYDYALHEAMLHQVERQMAERLNPTPVQLGPIAFPDRFGRVEPLPCALPTLVQLFARHQFRNEIGRMRVVV